jgi:hypothetical protein
MVKLYLAGAYIVSLALLVAGRVNGGGSCTQCRGSIDASFNAYTNEDVVKTVMATYIGQCATGGEISLDGLGSNDCTGGGGTSGCKSWGTTTLTIWRWCGHPQNAEKRSTQYCTDGTCADSISMNTTCSGSVNCANDSDCGIWSCL